MKQEQGISVTFGMRSLVKEAVVTDVIELLAEAEKATGKKPTVLDAIIYCVNYYDSRLFGQPSKFDETKIRERLEKSSNGNQTTNS